MILRHYEFMIAIRFLLKGRLQTLLIILGIAVGVAVQFFLSALIGGLQISLIERTVGTAAHILILPADSVPKIIRENSSENFKIINTYKTQPYKENTEILSWQQYVQDLKNEPDIKAVCPIAQGQCFIEKGGNTTNVTVKGINFPDGAIIYKFDKNIKIGKQKINGNLTLIGQGLADKLKISVGDNFYMTSSQANSDLFTVSGIFDLGSSQANNIVFLSLDRARNLLGIEGISSLEIQINDVFKAEKIASSLRNKYSRIKIESWQEKNRELLSALRSQSSSSDIIQFFVLFSITLGIASVLGIAAVQKSRQLGILKAMGVDNHGAAIIFIIQGLLLGLIGSVIGISLGYGLGLMFIKFASTASFELEITYVKIISPVILALMASTFASVLPARNASRLSPIEVIRNG